MDDSLGICMYWIGYLVLTDKYGTINEYECILI